MGKARQADSPAYQLLHHVWRHSMKATRHSWERLNHSMQDAMDLAISAGLKFEPDDFDRVFKELRAGRWCGADNGEQWYALAVAVGNQSAAMAFELFVERPPFIADDVQSQDFRATHRTCRARDRLAVGSRFPWKNHQVTVTSFAPSGAFLTACAYAKDSRKVTRRFSLTVAGIHNDRAERKAAAKGGGDKSA